MSSLLNDDAFARLVSEDVKNKISAQQRKILLESRNWARWQKALLLLIDNLQSQVDDIDDDAEADKERYEALGEDGAVLAQEAELAYSSRKTKIERFMFHVNRRLDEVTKLIDTGSDDHIQAMAQNDAAQAEFFRKAIVKHKDLLYEYDLEETAIDRALWDALDNRWTFESIDGI